MGSLCTLMRFWLLFCPWQFSSKTFRKCTSNSQCIQIAAQVTWCYFLLLQKVTSWGNKIFAIAKCLLLHCKLEETNFFASNSTSLILVNSVRDKGFITLKLYLRPQMRVLPPSSVDKKLYPSRSWWGHLNKTVPLIEYESSNFIRIHIDSINISWHIFILYFSV